MAYESHPEFTVPESDSSLVWRYMDLGKLLSLLDKKSLYFVRLDHLAQLDPFEGFYGRANLVLDQLSFSDLPTHWNIPDEKTWEDLKNSNASVRKFVKTQREYTFVNSWHMQDHESAGMWAQYLKTQEGIAIQSTYGKLRDSFRNYKEFNIHIGKMRYIDYDNTPIPTNNLLSPFLYKRKSFEHERELRCLIWSAEHGKNNVSDPSLNVFKDKHGLGVEVILEELIEHIFVAPTAPDWVVETLSSVVRKMGLNVPVIKSNLASVPLY